MAQNARTGSISRASRRARSAGGAALTLDAVGEQLWSLLTSMRFVLVVILGLAVLVLAGTVIMQAPAGVAGNPDAMAEWVGQVRPRYGGWTPVLEALQLFTAFTSVWFKILMTALSISLVACSVHRVRGLWRTSARPRVDVGDRFFEHAPQRESILARQAPAQTVASVRGALRQHHYRLLVAEDEDGLHAYADHNRWAPMGSLIGHLSLLFIVAGAIIGTSFGFRDTSFIVAEGATVPVAADGLSLQLVSFKDAYDPVTGMPTDYASDVILYRGGERVARQVVRVNEPLRYDGVSFYQSFFGAAAVVRVTDSSGTVVHAGGVPLAWSTNDDSRRVGTFSLSGAGLTVWVVESAGTDDPLIQPGQVRLEVYETSGDGQPIALQTIDQGQPTTVAGLDFTFERESAYTGLSVARDPGAPLVWLGALMLIGGFSVVLVFPHRRVWFRITSRRGGSTVALASVGRQDSGLGRDFTDLVTDLRRALQAPAKS